MDSKTSMAGQHVPRPKNFVAHLSELARTRPDDLWLTVVQSVDGHDVETHLTYGVFAARVRSLAARLQGLFERGDRVLVMLGNDDHYAVSMLACFHAGVIAVPVFPPESSRPQHLARLMGIVSDSQARGALTSAALKAGIEASGSQFGGLTLVVADDADSSLAQDWVPAEPRDEDVAFLQYTSGSTSAPKGVIVTHGCLMANEQALQLGMSVVAQDRFVSWSPLFHDMGLIGGLLLPLYNGIELVLTSPQYFLERPSRWLKLISKHRATISGGPDFAYRLCLDRVKGDVAAQLDLSSWRLAYTGAEPVRADTERAFIEKFAPAGFQAGAVYPCYGLAEAVLFVSGGQPGAGLTVKSFSAEALASGQAKPQEGGTSLVGCGAIAPGHQLRIVAPDSLDEVDPGGVGEIWVAGPSITAGYWGNEPATQATFVGEGGQRWLRTGDLGFVWEDQLFVAGRIKDVIIVRGHNLYPQDIERLVEAEVEAVRKGRVAAFAVRGLPGMAGEGIGVAAEISFSMQKLVPPKVLADALGVAVSEVVGEPLSVVVLLNPGALPRTSSGKLQRQACRLGWEGRSLDAYAVVQQGCFVLGGDAAADPPQDSADISGADQLVQAVARLWCLALERSETEVLARDAHFFNSGGNSLAATRLAARIAEQWRIEFPVRALFEHPRLSACIDEVRRRLASGQRAGVEVIPALPEALRQGALSLSAAQERQWFLWHLDPSSTAYHVAMGLRLTGALDVEALRTALQGLVDRHESLRTVFRAEADHAGRQEVLARLTLDMPVVDVSDGMAEQLAARREEAVRGINAQPFDLAHGPLLRACLLREAAQSHTLVLVMHHIVSDAASMQILIDELGDGYRAVVGGEGVGWPAPRLQYADYAAWQAGWLAHGAREAQLAYWRTALRGMEAPLVLPTDHPRLAVASRRAAHHSFELPEDLSAGLRALASGQGSTLFMVMLAGLQVLLHRHGGQRDVPIGVPVANRHRPGTEGIVGFFVNTQVLRGVLDGRMSLMQVLAQVRQMALDAQEHQDLPFEQLVEALRPERALGHTPLFQVMMNHLREDYRALAQATGLAIEGLVVDNAVAQFDLTVEVREQTDGRLRVRLIYAADLFEARTMARLGRHYVRVLRALAAQPAMAVGDVPLLDTEDFTVLGQGDSAVVPLPGAATIHALFEQQAKAHPEAVAVVADDERLSYAALNERANQLAHVLIAQGVRPESRVGIAVERSLDTVVGLLAILKSGGAYVPLDPAYPAERLAHMMQDSGIGLLLTQSHVGVRLPTVDGLRVLEIDAIDLAGQPVHDPDVPLHPEQLAYVIYTSGSTGKPKGAQLCHRNVVRLLSATQPWFGFGPQDVWTLFHSYAFDFSVWELFGALSTGGRVVVVPFWTSRSPDDMLALLRREQVTVLNQTPSAFRQLVHAIGAESAQGLALRHVVFGGEALEPASLREWMALAGDEHPRLINMYGITETTVHVTYRRITEADLIQGQRSPMGVCIPDLGAWVLDAELNLLPAGVPGELYVSGQGLARGYLGRAGLTAERFVAAPFGAAGGRLYRTGDLVRWNSAGEMEYLGRIDHQVKVRGFRIELGEVEAQLLAQPGVREALVIAVPDQAGASLAAYVVADGADPALADALKEALSRALPEHMVPAAITVLAVFPLNANGKVDRTALPAPLRTSGRVHADPASDMEQLVASVWSGVLGLEKVGRHDNFFEIGGHSLLLVRVHRQLMSRLDVRLTIVDLFRYPTVDSLAAFLASASPAADALSQVDERAQRQRQAFLLRKTPAERMPS